MTDDFLVIDGEKLATHLAWEEFRKEYEEKYAFYEIYEQVDDSGDYFMTQEFKIIFDALEQKYREQIEQFDVISLI